MSRKSGLGKSGTAECTGRLDRAFFTAGLPDGRRRGWFEWTEQRLQKLFQRYDQKFFDWRLRENGWTVMVKSIPKRGGGTVMFKAFTDLYEKQILFDPLFCWGNNWQMRATMLHEMAHAASGDGWHYENGAWCAEMKRLKAAGAPVGAGPQFQRRQEREFERELERGSDDE